MTDNWSELSEFEREWILQNLHKPLAEISLEGMPHLTFWIGKDVGLAPPRYMHDLSHQRQPENSTK